MRSRALRILLVLVCICGIAASAVFIRSLEEILTVRRAELRVFDRLAREASDALAEVRAAQEAYLVFGQGTDFWMAKVDTTIGQVTGALAALLPAATSEASKSFLDQAAGALAEFGKVDARIREYLKADSRLMAADVVFTEGGEAADGARRHIEEARVEEHLTFDRFEADNRKLEIAAVGAAGIVLLVTAMLGLVPVRGSSEVRNGSTSLNLTSAGESQAAANAPLSSGYDLPLSAEERPSLNPRKVLAAPPATLPETPPQTPVETPVEPPMQTLVQTPVQTLVQTTAPELQLLAQLCTDIGRVGEPQELALLLSRTADVLDASGLILWVAAASGSELRPALAHGYSAEMVARIPGVPRSANNAAAAAYRTGTLQVVPAQPGSGSKGAVVAPVVSADGCIGVLSAEIRNGREASVTIQSLATIFAAQLAGVVASTTVASTPVAPDQLATGSGAV